MLLHNPCIVGLANKTVGTVTGLSHNATGFIRCLFQILVGPIQRMCTPVFGFTMTVEIQDKTLWSQVQVK